METSNNSNGNHLLLDNTNKNTSNASSSTPIEANMNSNNNKNNNNNTNDDHRQTPTPILQQQQQQQQQGASSSTLKEKSLQHSSNNQQTSSSSSLVHQTQNHHLNNDNNNNKKKHINKNNNNTNPEENNKDFLSNDDEEDANNNNNNKSDSSSSEAKKDGKKINDDDEDTNNNHQSDQQSSLQHSSNNQQASLPPPKKNQKKKIVNKKKQNQSSGANNNSQTELRHSDQQSSLRSLQETAQYLMKLISEDKIEEMNKFFQDNREEGKYSLDLRTNCFCGRTGPLIHFASIEASPKTFNTLLQTIKNYGEEFAKQQLQSLTDKKETVFHCAVISNNKFGDEIFEAFFNFAKGILDEEELKKLLLEVNDRDYGRQTAFACVFDIDGRSDKLFQVVIETYAKFDCEFFEKVVLQKDKNGNPPIVRAAQCGSAKKLKLFINTIKQHRGKELLKKVLNKPCEKGSAGYIIISAFLNRAEPHDALKVIFKAFKEIGGIEYLCAMLLSKNAAGANIFMSIVGFNARSDRHLKIFVDVVQDWFNNNAFFKTMLEAEDDCRYVALHYLTDNNELKRYKNQALARYFCSLLAEVNLFSAHFRKLNVDEQTFLKPFGIDASFGYSPKQGLSSQTPRKMNSTNQQNQHQKALVALAAAAKINNNNINENNNMDNNSSSSFSSSAENNNNNNDNNDDETSNGDNTVEELKKQLSEEREKLEEAKKQVKKLEDTNETEKNKNKNIITSLQQQVEKLKASTEIAKKELAVVRKQAEEDRKTLKAQIVARNNTIAQKEESLFQKNQRFDTLQRQLDAAVKAREKMESNKNNDDNNNNNDYDVVDEEESLFHQLHQQEIKFKEELEEARQNTASALATLNDLHEQHNKKNQEVEMETTKRKELEQKLKGAEAAFNQHKKNSDETLASLQKQLEAANKSRNTSNKSNNNNNNNNSSNSDDNVAAAKMKAVEKERDESQKLVKEFKEKEEDRQKQLKNEQVKAAALKDFLSEANERITDLRIEIRALKKAFGVEE